MIAPVLSRAHDALSLGQAHTLGGALLLAGEASGLRPSDLRRALEALGGVRVILLSGPAAYARLVETWLRIASEERAS